MNTLAEIQTAARILRETGKRTWLYAFQAGDDGPIKIGTTCDPSVRLATLQTGNPYRLHPIACWRDHPEIERALHAEFADVRLEGEWFQPTADLLALADQYGDDWDWNAKRR